MTRGDNQGGLCPGRLFRVQLFVEMQPLGEVGSANWGGDWGRGPDSIHITFRNNFLYVDSCKNDECTMSEVRTYALREGKLVKVYVQTHKTR